MPDHIKALVVILALATVVFKLAKIPVCGMATSVEDFKRRRNLWFGITLALFLSHNFWLFLIIAACMLLYTLPREPNKLAIYFLVLLLLRRLLKQLAASASSSI